MASRIPSYGGRAHSRSGTRPASLNLNPPSRPPFRPATSVPASQRVLPALTQEQVRASRGVCSEFYERGVGGVSQFELVNAFLGTLVDPALVEVRNEGVEGMEVEYRLDPEVLQSAADAVEFVQRVLDRLREIRHSDH